jgi:guanyl-specific ribonuclease Sa
MYFLVIQILILAGAGGGTTALSSSSISSAPSASCDISASHSAILSVSKPVVASRLIPIAQNQTVEHMKDGTFNYLFLFRLYAE